MAHLARKDRLTRRSWLLAGLGMGVSARVFRAQAAPSFTPFMDGDKLYLTAPDFHFLNGRSLERLRNGGTVTYIAQLSLSLDDHKTTLRSQPQRFIFSCDVWEPDKFSVTKLGGATPRKGISMVAAEAWCLESLAISTAGIAPDRRVWLRLELRVADLKDQADMVDESGINIPNLIRALSLPARTLQQHWTVDVAPFRLSEVKKAGARGSRSG
jgi:hypothetical protein